MTQGCAPKSGGLSRLLSGRPRNRQPVGPCLKVAAYRSAAKRIVVDSQFVICAGDGAKAVLRIVNVAEHFARVQPACEFAVAETLQQRCPVAAVTHLLVIDHHLVNRVPVVRLAGKIPQPARGNVPADHDHAIRVSTDELLPKLFAVISPTMRAGALRSARGVIEARIVAKEIRVRDHDRQTVGVPVEHLVGPVYHLVARTTFQGQDDPVAAADAQQVIAVIELALLMDSAESRPFLDRPKGEVLAQPRCVA